MASTPGGAGQVPVADATSVYLYSDRRGVLLYVGISRQGTRRQAQHLRDSAWYPFSASQEIEHYETRDEALARETWLIRNRRPPFNVAQNPDHKILMAAYLVLFAPTTPAPQVLHPCLYCEDDDPACPWPDVEFRAYYTCPDPGCDVCHARWHGYEAGVPEGYHEGVKERARSAGKDRCGHCIACLVPEEKEVCLLIGRSTYATCAHCGDPLCVYPVAEESGEQNGWHGALADLRKRSQVIAAAHGFQGLHDAAAGLHGPAGEVFRGIAGQIKSSDAAAEGTS